jgi:hypothetical protein
MFRTAARITFGVLLAVVAIARGADVDFSISGRETYVGLPIRIQVTIKNAEDHEPPELPEIDGADVRLEGPSTQSSTLIVNGKVERTSSHTYAIVITPRRAGTLRVPSIVVSADGESRASTPTTISVRESENDGLLYLEIVGEKESVYVGEPIDVTLQVWLKPFSNRQVTLDESDMWRSCVDVRNSSWGPFADVIESGEVRVRTDTRRDDEGRLETYYVYLLRHRVWPERPGVFDASDITVVVQYPINVRQNRFSIFAPEHSISAARPVSAQVGDVSIQVKAPPAEGRPAIYRGAVGKYSMEVTAAPTEVAVGDPITVNIAIRGTGRLELLQPPPLTEQPELTANFRVPDEKLAGTIENGVKKFSQSIRAKHDSVAEIPPIRFAYFDPQAERYKVIESDPIPIRVKETSRMAVSQVVESGAATGGRTELTLLDEGVWANYDDVSELLAGQSLVPGWGVWACTGAGPAVYLLCFALMRYSDRLRGDQGFARRRSARRTALSRVGQAAGDNGSDTAAAVSAALTGYVADRCNLPAGGVTRTDAIRQLRSRAVPAEVVDQVNALLSRCESAQYAGGGDGAADDLVTGAKKCIEQLERRRF